jgi:hypothetical protein
MQILDHSKNARLDCCIHKRKYFFCIKQSSKNFENWTENRMIWKPGHKILCPISNVSGIWMASIRTFTGWVNVKAVKRTNNSYQRPILQTFLHLRVNLETHPKAHALICPVLVSNGKKKMAAKNVYYSRTVCKKIYLKQSSLVPTFWKLVKIACFFKWLRPFEYWTEIFSVFSSPVFGCLWL